MVASRRIDIVGNHNQPKASKDKLIVRRLSVCSSGLLSVQINGSVAAICYELYTSNKYNYQYKPRV
jgi:hypothetical protein